MARSRTEGMDAYRRRMLSLIPERLQANIRDANDKNAEEFMGLVRRIIPKGEPADGNLVETLEKRAGEGTSVIVTIGGPEAPHPLHLEAGHKNPDGSHTPPKPYWNPAKRVLRKKARGRSARALNKAIKETARG